MKPQHRDIIPVGKTISSSGRNIMQDMLTEAKS